MKEQGILKSNHSLKDDNLLVERYEPAIPLANEDNKDIDGLFEITKNKEHPVRPRVLEILKNTKSQKLLVSALKYHQKDIENIAIESLEFLGWAPSNKEESMLYFIAKSNYQELFKLGEDAVEPLLYALQAEDYEIRSRAAYLLGKLKCSRACDSLVKLIKGKSAKVRQAAIVALTEIGDPVVINNLIQICLASEDFKLRNEIERSLRKLKDTSPYKLLIESLKADPKASTICIDTTRNKSKGARNAAIQLLCELGDSAGIDNLVQTYLATEDSSLRNAIERSLRKLKDKFPYELLIESLKHESWSVRSNVVDILNGIKNNQVVEVLKQCLGDTNEQVRIKAAWALDSVEWLPKNEIEKSYYLIAKKMWPELKVLGKSAKVPLLEIHSCATPDIRKYIEILLRDI